MPALIGWFVSSITAFFCFEGPLNVYLTELEKNLYLIWEYISPSQSLPSSISADKTYHVSISNIPTASFGFSNKLVKCGTQLGKYMACCLLYKGDVVPKDVNAAVSAMKSRNSIQFVDWFPTVFKVGINNQPPMVMSGRDLANVQQAICILDNSTVIVEAWTLLDHRLTSCMPRRHFYIGILRKTWEFSEARGDLAAFKKDYKVNFVACELYLRQLLYKKKYTCSLNKFLRDSWMSDTKSHYIHSLKGLDFEGLYYLSFL